ncbi:enoyl-CoA hydratase/isomerase family protein [Pseudonocardia petroleophila]|uniref:Enoyl-CoA hydratase/isomerase family protein n=1 Tax=Pseudonocardia petroleophila TaxID=37331 RepID=A0A7G7MCH9_9PSEU|nr:enoyl-CoA hydratase/isomerase family protein [Pseudonocardia petroleophila]QNG50490.1 enoyl-CoA hydratase/isomerase family protein [Pseudonocardia petroleophila]
MERTEHIARLVVDRPEHGNLMTAAMASAIVEHLDTIEQDDDVKVVVISGAGADLSAGWDPNESWDQYVRAPGGAVRKHPSQRARLAALDAWWGPRGLFGRLLRFPRVTVLQATGRCFDAGLYLALCCDLVVASDDARFAFPRWHNVGVDGDLSLLIASVGLKRAKELMFCNAAWSAVVAREYGLVDDVAADPAARVEEYAQMCASIMRDGIVTEKYAVFASLEKMGIGLSFAAATVVGASLSNIHFQPDEYNFLADVRRSGAEAALERSRSELHTVEQP